MDNSHQEKSDVSEIVDREAILAAVKEKGLTPTLWEGLLRAALKKSPDKGAVAIYKIMERDLKALGVKFTALLVNSADNNKGNTDFYKKPFHQYANVPYDGWRYRAYVVYEK